MVTGEGANQKRFSAEVGSGRAPPRLRGSTAATLDGGLFVVRGIQRLSTEMAPNPSQSPHGTLQPLESCIGETV